jgi:hypothetical protein
MRSPEEGRGLATLLSDDTRFWRAAAGLFAIISILKGLRLPSLWAATQANLDYHQGFIKRGLFGQLARSLGIPIAHYDAFVVLSALLLLAMLALLGRWVYRSGALRLEHGATVAVFGASYALTYLTHLLGYLEIPMAVLALVAVSSNTASYLRLLGAGIAGCLGVLIHESYLLTFMPVTLLQVLLSSLAAGPASSPPARPGNRLRALLPIAVVVAAVAAVLVSIAWGAPMTPQRVNGLRAAMTVAVDFPTRDDFFPILTRSTADNVILMTSTMSNGSWWLAQCNAFIIFMPTAVFFLWIALDIVATCQPAAQRVAIKAAVLCASLCPLAMQLVGWDIYRWYALAAFSSFISLTIVCNHYGAAAAAGRSGALRHVGVLLIGINMATGTGLFDGYRVNTFPFVELWKSLLHWVFAGGHFPQPDA